MAIDGDLTELERGPRVAERAGQSLTLQRALFLHRSVVQSSGWQSRLVGIA